MDGWRYASDFEDFVGHFFMEVYLESIQMVKQIILFEFHFQRQPKPSGDQILANFLKSFTSTSK